MGFPAPRAAPRGPVSLDSLPRRHPRDRGRAAGRVLPDDSTRVLRRLSRYAGLDHPRLRRSHPLFADAQSHARPGPHASDVDICGGGDGRRCGTLDGRESRLPDRVARHVRDRQRHGELVRRPAARIVVHRGVRGADVEPAALRRWRRRESRLTGRRRDQDDGGRRSLLPVEPGRRDAGSRVVTPPRFAARVEQALADKPLRIALDRATTQLGSRRILAFSTLDQADGVRDQARAARLNAVAHLGPFLERFEAKLLANGAHVHWAETPDAANAIIADIAKQTTSTRAVKSKSMVSEETHLNDALERAGVTVVETDLGEYIVQLPSDPPSHIVAP